MDNKYGANIGIAATFALFGCALSMPLRADTLVVNEQLQVRQSDVARPARGLTMSAVEAKFGAPGTKHDAVGTPAITRWDYPQFAVFFEKDRVIDSVLPPQASEPSTSPASIPVTSAPAGSNAPATETQEPVAPTPESAAEASDAPIPSGAPSAPPAGPPVDSAAPSAAPSATPAAPAAPAEPAAPMVPTLPAASAAPAHPTTSSEDPMGVVPVSIGPSAATPTPASATPAAPAAPHP